MAYLLKLILVLSLILIPIKSFGKPSCTLPQQAKASYYGKQHHGRLMANGNRFNMYSMTVANKCLPFNTKLKITNPNSNQSVVVTVTDRGPYIHGRVLDLSYGAAKAIGLIKQGVGTVIIEKLE